MQSAANNGNWGTYNTRSKEINQLKSNISNNQEQLKNIKTADVLEVHNSKIDKLNTEITAINAKIDSLYSKKTKSGYNILFSNQEAFNNFLMWLAVLIELVGIYFSVIVGLNSSKKVRKITTIFYDGDEQHVPQAQYSMSNGYYPPQQLVNPNYNPATSAYNPYYNTAMQNQPGGYHQYVPNTPPEQYLNDPPAKEIKGFQMENNTGINPEIVKKYKDKMYDIFEDTGNVPGYRRIAKELDITMRLAEDIHSLLKVQGVIRTDKMKTIIIKSR
jgi:hypothetical protein